MREWFECVRGGAPTRERSIVREIDIQREWKKKYNEDENDDEKQKTDNNTHTHTHRDIDEIHHINWEDRLIEWGMGEGREKQMTINQRSINR